MFNEKFLIQVFCVEENLCHLIGKVFDKSLYDFHCNEKPNAEDVGLLSGKCDCVIIDKDIEEDLLEAIKLKFKGVPAVYLPSLDNVSNRGGNNALNISEPLKLSELKNAVDHLLTNEVF